MSVIDVESGASRFIRGMAGRAWLTLRSARRSRSYPALGAAVALGMTLGLPVAHALAAARAPTFGWAMDDLARVPVTYAYVLLASLAAATVLGHLLGRWSDRVRILSRTDPLTGLFNRRHFGERLAGELSRARRRPHSTSVLCLDLDHLKAINDRLGHKAGDRALVALAGAIARSLRPTDVAARFGGDEFVVLLPESAEDQAGVVARRILAAVELQNRAMTERFQVSIGISELSASASAEDFLAGADQALYRAKAAGGGRAARAGGPGFPASRLRGLTLGEAALLIDDRVLYGVPG